MPQSPDVQDSNQARTRHQVPTTNGALMTTPQDRVSHLDLIARLRSSFPDLPQAPTPDLIDHERFTAYIKTVHDVGGEPAAPEKFENKQYEGWEENTYVLCELLGWRGIWHSEERRRIGNVDVGRTIYLGLPYYGRWVLAAARILVDKHHITLGELPAWLRSRAAMKAALRERPWRPSRNSKVTVPKPSATCTTRTRSARATHRCL